MNDGRATRLNESSGDLSRIGLTVVSNDIVNLIDWNTDHDLHSSDHFPIHLQLYNPDPMPNMPPIFTRWNVHKAYLLDRVSDEQ